MASLDHEMFSDAPQSEYLRFVEHFLQRPTAQKLAQPHDPFAPIPHTSPSAAYIVDRAQVSAQVYRPGNHVLSGRRGAGKTTLCLAAGSSQAAGVLTVRLVLTAVDFRRDRPTWINPAALIWPITATFWEELAPHLKTGAIDFRNPDPAWLRILRWCGQHFPSRAVDLSQLSQQWAEEDAHQSGNRLRDVIRLITECRVANLALDDTALREEMIERFNIEDLKTLCQDMTLDYEAICGEGRGKESSAREIIAYCARRGRRPDLIKTLGKARPGIKWTKAQLQRRYEHLRLLIDCPDEASAEQQCQVVENAVDLTLSYQRVYATIFIGENALDVVSRHGEARRQWPDIHPFPPWSAEELRKLLWRRLALVADGEYDDSSGVAENFLRDVPAVCLSQPAKESFLSIVVEGALRADALYDHEAAPAHALRLARLLLTACAKRWANQELAHPLVQQDLKEWCNRYWSVRRTEGEGKHA